jgi:uncharacterized membrane protein
MAELWAVVLVLIGAFMGSFGALYFKKGADRLHLNLKSLLDNWELMVGIAIYGASTVVYVIGLRGGELSVIFPLVSTGYAWTCLLSVKFLGEKMNGIKWAGIGLILVGVSLIGLGH